MLDFVGLSLRENRFWLKIEEEHALFMRLGFPCDEKGLIEKARRFEQQFAAHRARVEDLVRVPDRKMREINDHSLALVEELVQFKTHVLDRLINCKLGGFLFPLLIVHIRREGQRFSSTLRALNAGETGERQGRLINDIALNEVFWTLTMAEHAKFISHLLDPTEEKLIKTANSFAHVFDELNKEARRLEEKLDDRHKDVKKLIRFTDDLVKPAENIINFKAKAEKLLLECEILSIINPLLADHVRREAEKFLAELKEHKQDLKLVK